METKFLKDLISATQLDIISTKAGLFILRELNELENKNFSEIEKLLIISVACRVFAKISNSLLKEDRYGLYFDEEFPMKSFYFKMS